MTSYSHYGLTYVSIFVFSFGAAAHIAYSPDVLLLEAGLIVENSDAVSLHHKGKSWNNTSLCWITVVISVLKNSKQRCSN